MCKIMVVDDNDVHRELIATVARKAVGDEGQVREFGDPKAFIHAVLFERDLPDVIVIDFLMPDMDGISALRSVRSQGANCPAIVLTAACNEAMHKLLPTNNVKFLMKKPFSPKELLENILQACHSVHPDKETVE